MNENENLHFIERKVLDFQRSSSKGYACPYCPEGFQQEPKLWEHARTAHRDSLDIPRGVDEGPARKQLRVRAVEKASKTTKKHVRHGSQLGPKPPFDHRESPLSDRVEPGSTATTASIQDLEAIGTPEASGKIGDFGRLTLGQRSDHGIVVGSGNEIPTTNPLKRGLTDGPETLQTSPQGQLPGPTGKTTRREKALSLGPFVVTDPDSFRDSPHPQDDDYSRNLIGTGKRLYNPDLDDPSRNPDSPRKSQFVTSPTRAQWSHDATVRISKPEESSRPVPAFGSPFGHTTSQTPRPGSAPTDRPDSWAKLDREYPDDLSHPVESHQDQAQDPQPQIIRQPETRPISHDQLVVEVKGIYAGLVLVEQKCKEVDEKQSAAALERDPTRKAPLSNEQWQALIALHKTLLHEHHDFFLASQHPSASPTLSKLAGKYSMPARMWRHGIHSFLEVLRHQLPASSDHMLAFIYIAYSMMALLYETVSAFEETWIECLGDLARYRMAIEEHDVQDREIWGGVARFWYSKAADKRPEIGRLCHHLAILARPNSLQQLAYYSRSLACVVPFSSARSSIMTLFQPILQGKLSTQHRPKALEISFIKIHANLFVHGQPIPEVMELFANIKAGLLDDYISRVTTRFREQGVSMALTNIAAIFEYGALTANQTSRSICRLAFLDVWTQKLTAREAAKASEQKTEMALDIDEDKQKSLTDSLRQQVAHYPSEKEVVSSRDLIVFASQISFTILAIVLQRPGDTSVFPLVHVMFCFIWSLTSVEKVMLYVEHDIPWGDICAFLNTLAKPEALTPKIWSQSLPKPDGGVTQPLPEDFAMRGQLCALWYYPDGWYEGVHIDIEERSLELPSMAATRIERILWLGMGIATVSIGLSVGRIQMLEFCTQWSNAVSPSPILRTDYCSLVLAHSVPRTARLAEAHANIY
ncbi:MAG: hypothetical protein Q9216_000629 [Gyalolechia sp. 2 TL-2023]